MAIKYYCKFNKIKVTGRYKDCSICPIKILMKCPVSKIQDLRKVEKMKQVIFTKKSEDCKNIVEDYLKKFKGGN